MPPLHVVSVFAGIGGGVDLSGLSRAPVVVAFGSESRTRRCRRHRRVTNRRVIVLDARNLDAHRCTTVCMCDSVAW